MSKGWAFGNGKAGRGFGRGKSSKRYLLKLTCSRLNLAPTLGSRKIIIHQALCFGFKKDYYSSGIVLKTLLR